MQLLTSKEAAHFLAVSEPSLRSMRSMGLGPAYHHVGTAVRYRLSALQAYVDGLDAAATVRRNNRLARQKKKGAPAGLTGAP